jgi:hypothetical protein
LAGLTSFKKLKYISNFLLVCCAQRFHLLFRMKGTVPAHGNSQVYQSVVGHWRIECWNYEVCG